MPPLKPRVGWESTENCVSSKTNVTTEGCHRIYQRTFNLLRRIFVEVEYGWIW
jgi:hypothetical protein